MALTDQKGAGSDRLILSIKSAYWMALLIIVAMALANYLLLQHMMAEQKRGEAVISLVGVQKTLSQRIVLLANAADYIEPERARSLIGQLHAATAQFEANHELLVRQFDAETGDATDGAGGIFTSPPHHLDHYSTSLAENARRLVSVLESRIGISGFDAGTPVNDQLVKVDSNVASTTLAGYTALGDHLSQKSSELLDELLYVHRILFFSTIGVICLIALFIFRPMSELIRRRTGELVDARNSMAYLAIHDALTGLHNRTFVRDQFDKMIQKAASSGDKLVVIQIDLDRFKQINDTLGHAAGDFVLSTTAQRMREYCGVADICARLGGDEFLLVLSGARSSKEMEALAAQVLSGINRPIVYEKSTIFSGASAGVATYPADADNASDLLVHADLALYAAKKLGGGTLSFFTEQLRLEQEHRKLLERDLVEAVAKSAFSVYFQPQMSLIDGTITGVEALVRWKHPTRGMVSPADFVPIAELAGTMPAIGRIVMRKAIKEAAAWHRAGIQFGRLSLNASGAELREPDYSNLLFAALKGAGLPPEKLSLEIVESVILDDEKAGLTGKLREIRAAGVHLELDDFGTGYASLTHVNPNEIDRLKIDRRFVQNINLNPDNLVIVKAIVELARGLGIAIIAEGAETDAELTALLSLGCEQVQGYAVAFPMPSEQAREWLSKRSVKRPAPVIIDAVAG